MADAETERFSVDEEIAKPEKCCLQLSVCVVVLAHPGAFDERGIDLAVGEGGVIEDLPQERDRGFDAFDFELPVPFTGRRMNFQASHLIQRELR